MGGEIWAYPFNFYGCNSMDDSSCMLSFFDNFRGSLSLSDAGMGKLRNGRCALSNIVIGLYMVYYGSTLLLPQRDSKSEEKIGEESFDGNLFLKNFWERSYFVFYYISMVMVMVVIIYWSLSNSFGNNVWYYLVTLKILGKIAENLSENWFKSK